MKKRIRIGTSGWTYPHWKGVFYPADRPKSKWLEYYAEHFDTVEVNATFYRLPKPETFEDWRNRTPDRFLWAVKGSKYITHTKKLREPKEPLSTFYGAISGLKEKLGPILFQLPPNLSVDEKSFVDFCASLNPSYRHTIEVRHPSWIDEPVFDVLNKHNIALCIADTAGRYPYHEVLTADFVYIRLHGSKKLYASSYSEGELLTWAEKIQTWERDTYLYFDNDASGFAVMNAERLKEILG